MKIKPLVCERFGNLRVDGKYGSLQVIERRIARSDRVDFEVNPVVFGNESEHSIEGVGEQQAQVFTSSSVTTVPSKTVNASSSLSESSVHPLRT